MNLTTLFIMFLTPLIMCPCMCHSFYKSESGSCHDKPDYQQSWYFNNANNFNRSLVEGRFSNLKKISNNTFELAVKLIPGVFSFKAGDNVALYFNAENKDNIFGRRYSMSNTPEDYEKTGELRFAISSVEGGMGTNKIQELYKDETILALGPFGQLRPDEIDADEILILTTGTGLGPVISLSNELAALKNKKINIIAGFSTYQQAIYINELNKLAEHPHINIRLCFSKEYTEDHLYGHVQNHIPSIGIDLSANNNERLAVFAYGNPNMLKQVNQIFDSKGFVKGKNIITEPFEYSGHNSAYEITRHPRTIQWK